MVKRGDDSGRLNFSDAVRLGAQPPAAAKGAGRVARERGDVAAETGFKGRMRRKHERLRMLAKSGAVRKLGPHRAVRRQTDVKFLECRVKPELGALLCHE